MTAARLVVLGLVVFGVVLGGAVALSPGAPAPSETPSPTPTRAARSTPEPTAPPIPDGYRVAVPRLGIDLPIKEGDVGRDVDQQQTPEDFAFHLPGSAIPGAGGNSYFYAHARAGMFLALWEARVGDEVHILTPDGRTLRYVVTEVRPRVAPEDVEVAMPTTYEQLVLQTSTGPDPDDPRFVVIAHPMTG